MAGYVGLVAVSGWRLLRWPRQMTADVASARGFAFLSFVAASNVLAVLLVVGLAGWLMLGYGVPLGLIGAVQVHTIKRYGPDRFVGFSPIPAMSMIATALCPL